MSRNESTPLDSSYLPSHTTQNSKVGLIVGIISAVGIVIVIFSIYLCKRGRKEKNIKERVKEMMFERKKSRMKKYLTNKSASGVNSSSIKIKFKNEEDSIRFKDIKDENSLFKFKGNNIFNFNVPKINLRGSKDFKNSSDKCLTDQDSEFSQKNKLCLRNNLNVRKFADSTQNTSLNIVTGSGLIPKVDLFLEKEKIENTKMSNMVTNITNLSLPITAIEKETPVVVKIEDLKMLDKINTIKLEEEKSARSFNEVLSVGSV